MYRGIYIIVYQLLQSRSEEKIAKKFFQLSEFCELFQPKVDNFFTSIIFSKLGRQVLVSLSANGLKNNQFSFGPYRGVANFQISQLLQVQQKSPNNIGNMLYNWVIVCLVCRSFVCSFG